MPNKEERDAAFGTMDFNCNGALSLAEIDKAVISLWPSLNNKPALMRAYKAADKNRNGFINRREFRLLLEYLMYFNDLWSKFEEIDGGQGGDRRLDLGEFQNGCAVCGLSISASEAQAEFEAMDENGGGFVLFDEFCAWIARRQGTGGSLAEEEAEEVGTDLVFMDEQEDYEPAGYVTRSSCMGKPVNEATHAVFVKVHDRMEEVDRPTRHFRQIDRENTGSIPSGELRNALRILKVSLSREDCEMMIDATETADKLVSIDNFLVEVYCSYLTELRNKFIASSSQQDVETWYDLLQLDKIDMERFVSTSRSELQVSREVMPDGELEELFSTFAARTGFSVADDVVRFMQCDNLLEYAVRPRSCFMPCPPPRICDEVVLGFGFKYVILCAKRTSSSFCFTPKNKDSRLVTYILHIIIYRSYDIGVMMISLNHNCFSLL